MENPFKDKIDFGTLIITLILTVIGIVSIYSATYDAGASSYVHRQTLWAVAGIVCMIAVMLIPFRTLQLLSYPVYGVCILLLAGVFIFGQKIAGSTSWFGVGGLGVQPSEIAKPATVLALAAYLSRRQTNLHRPKHVLVTFVLVLLLVIALTKGGMPNFSGFVTGSLAIGVFTFLWGPYMGHNWFELPWHMIRGDIIDCIAAWGLCGVWLGWWLNRK